MRKDESLEVKESTGRNLRKRETYSEGDNARYTMNALMIASLPRIDTNDAWAVQNRVEEYFRICMEQDMKPSISGLSLALGVERLTIKNWLAGKTKKPPEVMQVISSALALLSSLMENYMQDGKINPVSGIFLMKNSMMGYSNADDEGASTEDYTDNGYTAEEISRKYKNLLD